VLETGGGARLERGLAAAYRYLNRRERTQAEMRAHLEAKGVEATVLEEVIETLVDEGLLDDARYARMFTEDKRELEGWGSERIRRTLRARGVEREEIEAALRTGSARPGSEDAEGRCGDSGEVERAVALLRRRFPIPPDGGRERERALGVLLRKGYDSEVALEALARRCSEDGC
jgi:regulatory protein